MTALPDRVPIVVVDNASSDGTVDAVAASYPQVTLVRGEVNLGSLGRNLAVRGVRTPYRTALRSTADLAWSVREPDGASKTASAVAQAAGRPLRRAGRPAPAAPPHRSGRSCRFLDPDRRCRPW